MCRSVPSGRVGNAKDAIFRSNDHFRQALAEREDCDVAELQHRLDRSLEKAERARIGVGQLRRFLEQLLQRRYEAMSLEKLFDCATHCVRHVPANRPAFRKRQPG